MDVAVFNPKFLVIPLAGLSLASFAIVLWQWRTTRKDWTLAVPVLSTASSFFSFVVILYGLSATPGELYVRYFDLPHVQDNALIGSIGRQLNAYQNNSIYEADFAPYSRFNYAARSEIGPLISAPTLTIKDIDERNRLAWFSLYCLAFLVPIMLLTTTLHLAPGEPFDRVRSSLFVAQVNAPTGTVLRGPIEQGPRAVPHYEETAAVQKKSTSERQERRRSSLSRLRQLEIEASASKHRQATLKTCRARQRRSRYHYRPRWGLSLKQ
jgi:hypothetical protein